MAARRKTTSRKTTVKRKAPSKKNAAGAKTKSARKTTKKKRKTSAKKMYKFPIASLDLTSASGLPLAQLQGLSEFIPHPLLMQLVACENSFTGYRLFVAFGNTNAELGQEMNRNADELDQAFMQANSCDGKTCEEEGHTCQFDSAVLPFLRQRVPFQTRRLRRQYTVWVGAAFYFYGCFCAEAPEEEDNGDDDLEEF